VSIHTNRRDKGFTLIELLITIVIIGALAAIAIPIVLMQRQKAMDASAKSDARSLATQIESFYTEDLSYPGDAAYAFTGPEVALGSEIVRMSPGNIPSVHVNDTGTAFCVSVENPGKSSHPYVWQSDNGGLQADAAASCTAYGPALS
jgi:prepilin-type N-terminal cleavage/methylation domain-containing protein